MVRKTQRLSVKAVAAKKKPGYHPDGDGLYLQIGSTGTKSWVFRYMLHGKAREMGLGSLKVVSLADARTRAAEQRALLHDRVDPIEARDAGRASAALSKAKSITFAKCAADFIKVNRAGWKNPKHASQWENTLETYCGPILGKLAVQAVDTGGVLRVLEPIWTEKPETARRLRGRIEKVLDWSTAREYRTGDNPARWRGHLDKLLPTIKKKNRVRHHPALPFDDMGKFMTSLRPLEGMAPQALEFLILTVARTGEVLGARRDEFDLAKAMWTVPAGRMKGEREHRVPLSTRAVAIVRDLLKTHDGEYVFSGQRAGKPLSNMALLQVLQERMGREDLTVHGFRSTFRDWAAERTNFAREVCEMALAHVISDETEAAYRRGDLLEKRRQLMAKWAEHCDTVKPQGGKVTPIRKAAA
jgi:integrase